MVVGHKEVNDVKLSPGADHEAKVLEVGRKGSKEQLKRDGKQDLNNSIERETNPVRRKGESIPE